MRFSVFLVGRSTAPEHDREVIQALTEHAREAEQLGFDAVFMPDHHFTGYAPMSSDPFVYAAYLAGQLTRVTFGMSVTTVPLHHPVRFAERINLLDQLTDGRLLVGIGSGTTPEEMIGFGVNYKETGRIAQENLDIAEQLWQKAIGDDPITFDTGHYKGALVQRIVPRPYRERHAPLMSVALRESSALRAAQSGYPAFIPAFTPPKIGGTEPLSHVTKYFRVYRDALLAAGHPQDVVDHALSWTTHTYQCVHVAETDEQAREELEVILRGYQSAIDREMVFNKRAEEISDVTIHSTPDALSDDWIGTWCLYGSPETVTAHLREYQDLGIGNVLLGFTTGPLTPERRRLGDQAMRLFAERVMPHFTERALVGAAP
ncbi:alkanesulfonate monooxygenase SsuD/methylene tetrahydromethanopterin reductase-like flavin-dependent oxidoreductase (luciferase family) [Deinococcus metalli]|uniref:Alkanesulfonate monooxygenase n=1 Tax=Deinococcus metalli TaxID=1141878 RepID=A0A7W8KEN0_9DEIO|nr:LLM class flavin-dependent oxidoreductase [Deinococcus metalli]MBB5376780.1 alkanesulfonate monooxygenase SsuD/methylene tetrahydromethanopterin reductase-like flavin-dependent oxidoreductase (luciferase family) [Deinococcus metalli]GHF45294.1 alkanesulfonate monooxygenase [Deinococcus metalli]